MLSASLNKTFLSLSLSPNAEFPYNWSLRSCTVHTPNSTMVRRQLNIEDRGKATNSVRNRPRSGSPRSTTNREDRYITNMALRQRTTTARRLRDNLRTATGTRVSHQTIRNRLRANNLRCRRQAVRPPLLPRHRTARRHWCTLHLRWQRVQWGRVMFTDESRFSIQFNDGRVRVYRRPGERFADVNVRQRHRFGGGSVMVWGGISIHHRTPSMWWMAI